MTYYLSLEKDKFEILAHIPYISPTNNNCAAVGRFSGFFAKQESTKSLKSLDQSPPDKDGESFCAIW